MQRICPSAPPAGLVLKTGVASPQIKTSPPRSSSLPADRFPRPHPHRPKAFLSLLPSSAAAACRCGLLFQLSAFSFFPWSNLSPSLAGAFWKFRRLAVLRLCSWLAAAQGGGVAINRESEEEAVTQAGRLQRSSEFRAEITYYRCCQIFQTRRFLITGILGCYISES